MQMIGRVLPEVVGSAADTGFVLGFFVWGKIAILNPARATQYYRDTCPRPPNPFR
jgi:hypothetical protein